MSIEFLSSFIHSNEKKWLAQSNTIIEYFEQLKQLNVSDIKRMRIIREINLLQKQRNNYKLPKDYPMDERLNQYDFEIVAIDEELNKLGAKSPEQIEKTNEMLHIKESRQTQYNLNLWGYFYGWFPMITLGYDNINKFNNMLKDLGYNEPMQKAIVKLTQMKQNMIKAKKSLEPSKTKTHEAGIISL